MFVCLSGGRSSSTSWATFTPSSEQSRRFGLGRHSMAMPQQDWDRHTANPTGWLRTLSDVLHCQVPPAAAGFAGPKDWVRPACRRKKQWLGPGSKENQIYQYHHARCMRKMALTPKELEEQVRQRQQRCIEWSDFLLFFFFSFFFLLLFFLFFFFLVSRIARQVLLAISLAKTLFLGGGGERGVVVVEMINFHAEMVRLKG